MCKKLWQNIWLYLAILAVFLLFFLPLGDTDFGWHWRYGQYIWQNHRVLKTNLWTVLDHNYYWPQSFHGFQLLTFVIFNLFGRLGLGVASGLLFAGMFWLVYLLTGKKTYTAWLAWCWLVLGSWAVFWLGWRAQLFSILFMLILVWLLQRKQKIWVVGLFWLWVNTHGGFALGLAVFGIYLGLVWLEALVKNKRLLIKKTTSSLVLGLGAVTAICFNPYGLAIWLETWRHMNVPLNRLIAEWTPPPVWWQGAMWLVWLAVFVRIIKLKQKSFWPLFYFINLCVFFYLSLTGRRFMPYFFLFSGLGLSSMPVLARWEKNINYQSFGRAVILTVLGFGLFFRLPMTVSAGRWERYCSPVKGTQYPCKAVDFIKTNSLKGDWFNAYEWGGFLVWQLPESRFFVDGRMPAWDTESGDSPYTIYLRLIQAQEGWDQEMEKFGIDYLLIGNGTFLDLAIKDSTVNDQGYRPWQEVYRDSLAVIYRR